MILEQRVPLPVVCHVDRAQIGIDRHFRIDHDAGAVRQADGHVGNRPAALLVGHRVLLAEVAAVLRHAGALDDVAQLDFPPAAALVRRFERADQPLGFAPEPLLRVADGLKLRGQRLRRARAVAVHRRDVFADSAERLPQRLDQAGDLLLPCLEIRARGLLHRLERHFRELEERLVVGLQRVGGQRPEGVLERGPGRLHDRDLFRGPLAFAVEFSRQPGAVLLGGREFALGRRPADEPCRRGDREPDRQSGSEREEIHDGRSLGEGRADDKAGRLESPAAG